MEDDLKPEKIAFGGDSSVYKVYGPDGAVYVKKVYDGGPLCNGLPIEKIYLYWEVTKKVADLLNKKPANIFVGDEECSVVINPIKDVLEECGCPVLIAPFIEGETLAKHPSVGRIRAQLFKISKTLNEELRLKGIEITPGNTKKVGGLVVVTDLCATVRGLYEV